MDSDEGEKNSKITSHKLEEHKSEEAYDATRYSEASANIWAKIFDPDRRDKKPIIPSTLEAKKLEGK